eukprot:TRINITY_DN4874_c0_g1_i1.p1 TRINITY_DN4874_c0_g1~~TRINITY_DN4874_c0_g1_i1.p1  ORF type:complete len:732 (+),score=136.91 TRINITY_DN4874_c0_g1_i1:92-2287(+)
MVAEEVHGCGPSNGTNGNFGSSRISQTWPGLNADDVSSGSEEPIAASFPGVAAPAPPPTNAMFSDADEGPTSDDPAAGAAEDIAEEAGDSGGGEYASGDTTLVGASPPVPKESGKKAKDDNHKSTTMYKGKIAIIYEEKGFGFIESQQIPDIYACDTVFVHCKHLHGFEVGHRVGFSLSHSSKSGKPQAHSLHHLIRRRGKRGRRANHGTLTSVTSGPAPSSAEREAEAERLAAAGTSGDDRPYHACDWGKFGVRAGGCGKVLSTTQTPTQAFYEGTITSFDPGNGAGYISSPEARREFGRDVLVFGRQQSASEFRVGDEVKFKLRMNKKKYPQAFYVCVTWAAPTDEELNKDYQGTIKMVDPDKGYGFIRCMDLHSVYNSDIFVHREDLAGFSLGDTVTFRLQFDSQHRPKGVSLQDAKEPTTAEAPLTGTVKSFALEHGYGFISSMEAQKVYGRVDVFVHSKQIKHFVPGDHVTFIVKVTGHGRPQAYCLELAPNTVGWLAGDEDVPAKPLPLPDPEATYIGEIKSFSAKDGYGFIGCQQLSDHFGRDVFLHTMQYEGLAIGDRVEFKVKVRKGAPQAYDIVRLPSLLEEEGGEGQAGARPEVTPEQLVVLNRKLMRACASAMVDSAAEMDSLLRAGADPHARDATGDSALMVSALNVRNAERKCKLLIESRADPMARANEDEGNEQTVIEWARERLSPKFAQFLEAVTRADDMSNHLIELDRPPGDEF